MEVNFGNVNFHCLKNTTCDIIFGDVNEKIYVFFIAISDIPHTLSTPTIKSRYLFTFVICFIHIKVWERVELNHFESLPHIPTLCLTSEYIPTIKLSLFSYTLCNWAYNFLRTISCAKYVFIKFNKFYWKRSSLRKL